ncbi:MAG: S8 family serine peptidase [Bacteroidota bacterium]
MKKSNILKRLFATFSTFLVLIGSIQSQTVSKDYEDGKLFVKIKSNYLTSLSFINNNGANNNLPISTLPFLQSVDKKYKVKELTQPFIIAKDAPELQRIYQLTIADIWRIDAVVKYLNKQEGVEYAEKVPLRYSQLTPNDPSYLSNQWFLNKIGASSAWDKVGTNSVVVAVVDDGVQITHPDLAANIWVNPGEIAGDGIDNDNNGYIDDINGWDVANNDNGVSPDDATQDHGTHVAGLVAAVTNNTIGIASIGGLRTKLMILKHSKVGSTSLSNTPLGVLYAINNGAKVVNMSYGKGAASQAEQDLFSYGYAKGVIFVASAGNENATDPLYSAPAFYNYVISVAATDVDDKKASFSNYNLKVDISAPGTNIYSTIPFGGYESSQGTSMASPIVAGTIAAMLSANPQLTPDDIETMIKTTSVNHYTVAGNGAFAGKLGAGRIDANQAMIAAVNSLTWAPVPLFSANNTTISAGGSVSFSNLTKNVFSPTTYTWSFQGGLPATSTSTNPPAIVYNTPGTYSVALRANNVNGTGTYSVVNYITVNPAPLCTVFNNPLPPGWSIGTYTLTTGYPFGTNGASFSKEFANYFDATAQSGTLLQGVYIALGALNNANPTKVIPVKIYSVTPTGAPGAQLGVTNVTINQLYTQYTVNPNVFVSFAKNPINIPSRKFFVSLDLATSNVSWTVTPRDVLGIGSNADGQTTPSAEWEKLSNGNWQQGGAYGVNLSLIYYPLLSSPTGSVNTALTASSPSICEGEVVTYTTTGMNTIVNYFVPGVTSIIDQTNPFKPKLQYGTAGTFTTVVSGLSGACNILDAANFVITVKPNPILNISGPAGNVCSGVPFNLGATAGAATYTWSPSTFLSATSTASVVCTPTTNISYDVGATGANGCVNNANIPITVNQNAVANVVTSPTIISSCTGLNTVTFDASGSSDVANYSWSAPGASPPTSNVISPTFTFATPGTYTVSLSASNSCNTDNTYSKVVTVSACAGAQIQLLESATNISNGSFYSFGSTLLNTPIIKTFTIKNNGLAPLTLGSLSALPTGFSLLGTFPTAAIAPSGSSTFSVQLNATSVGTYSGSLTFVNGDVANSPFSVNISGTVTANTVGLNEMTYEKGISIYPNPANNKLNVSTITNFNNASISLYDVTGKLVMKKNNIDGQTQNIDISQYSSGLYFVEINQGGDILRRKVIIE